MREQLASAAIQILAITLTTVVGGLLSWLIKEAIGYLQRLGRVKDNAVAIGILSRLNNAAQIAVQSVQQTFVSKLDPSRPAESLRQAKDAAVEQTKTVLGPAGIEALKKIVGGDNLEAVVSHAIESAVHDVKQGVLK